jgi:sugar (pentulose or hexulose) kinase
MELSQKPEEISDNEGFQCDDLDGLTQWVRQTMDVALQDERYDIRALNFSTYGASFVHLDASGEPVAPLYNYLKPLPEAVEKSFYGNFGSKETVALETASPALGMLNSGLQLYWLKKEYPAVFEKIKTSLHLPQYLAFLFHGQYFSDITSIGCHTALWDFKKHDYHDWVSAASINEKLAPILKSDKYVETDYHGKVLKVGVGLHDSSAAFIPYIQSIPESFVLISTGTWCISMNPFNTSPLTEDELKQDCLCYMTYKGTPVKASRLFAGYEHEQAVRHLSATFKKPGDYYKTVRFNADQLPDLNFEWPEYVHPAPDELPDYETAYHHLVYKLVRDQVRSTKLVLYDDPDEQDVRQIYVDGGFARNEIYMKLMAIAFADFEVFASSVSQASALGAALAIHRSWNRKPLPKSLLTLKRYLPGVKS